MFGFSALSSINLWFPCYDQSPTSSVSTKLYPDLGHCARQYLSLEIPVSKYVPAYFFQIIQVLNKLLLKRLSLTN